MRSSPASASAPAAAGGASGPRTSRVRSSGLRASRSGRCRSFSACRTAASKSGWDRTQQLRLRDVGGEQQGVVGQRPFGPPLRHHLDRDPAEVVGEQPVAPVADDEVGADGAGQVGGGEVGVPPVRLGEGDEVPGELGVVSWACMVRIGTAFSVGDGPW